MIDLKNNRYSSQWIAENAIKKYKIVGQKISAEFKMPEADAGDVFDSKEKAEQAIAKVNDEIRREMRSLVVEDRRDFSPVPDKQKEKARQVEIDKELDKLDSVLQKVKRWKVEQA